MNLMGMLGWHPARESEWKLTADQNEPETGDFSNSQFHWLKTWANHCSKSSKSQLMTIHKLCWKTDSFLSNCFSPQKNSIKLFPDVGSIFLDLEGTCYHSPRPPRPPRSSWSRGEHLAASNKPSSLVSCLRMVWWEPPRNHGIQISKVKNGKTWPEKKVKWGLFPSIFWDWNGSWWLWTIFGGLSLPITGMTSSTSHKIGCQIH